MYFTDIFLLLLFMVVIVIIYLVDNTSSNIYSYYTHPSNLDPNFKADVRRILLTSGWRKYHRFKEVRCSKYADIQIHLSADDDLEIYHNVKQFYPSGKQVRFSITTQNRNNPPTIYINANNWLYGIPESELSLKNYRTYVIEHEFGHALSYDHQPCNNKTAVNGICPVMYQSTVGCPTGFKCGKSVIASDATKKIDAAYFQ
jgi:hypothetical protein